ncbi:MAG: hypothetical protein H0U52_12455 [Chloroflexi bacterium]|nr:hypothetical protein [Chloroflexota bacterium]
MALAALTLLPIGAPSTALACSGARVEYSEIRAEATRIVVGTIIASRGDPLAPDVLAIRVDRLIRGSSPAQLVLQPPEFMGCDGPIGEPVGTRLIIATGQRFFDAAPPQDLHPYWIVRADNTVDPVGVESHDPAVRTLDDLVVALGGELNVASTDPPVEVSPTDHEIAVAPAEGSWALPLAIGLLVAAVLLGLAARNRGRQSD